MQGTVASSIVQRLIQEAEQHGLTVADEFYQLSAEASADRLQGQVLRDLWNSLEPQKEAASFPLRSAASLRLDQLGPFGFVIQTAATIQEALALACWAYPVITNTGTLSYQQSSEGIEIVWRRLPEPDKGMLLSDLSVLANFASSVQQMHPELSVLKALCLPTCAPKNLHALSDFFSCPVYENQDNYRLVFHGRPCQAALPMAHLGMNQYFQGELRGDLQSLTTAHVHPFLQRVESLILAGLAEQDSSIERVAAGLHLTRRTLHRRLAELGASYRVLLSQVRQKEAQKLLQDSSLPLTEVAFRLGFAELSSFSRAYRKWYAESPRATQRRQTQRRPWALAE